MSWYLPGAPAVNSTAGTATNPTTSVLLAQITSSGASTAGGMNSSLVPLTQICAYFYLGTSTQATTWWLEHCLSTGLGSTAIKDRTVVITASGQTSQFVKKYDLAKGDLVRVRVATGFTGTADAKIQAEQLA